MGNNQLVRQEIRIKGIVQGVGFRPFIYSLATQQHLKGFVLNNDNGVVIEAEGPTKALTNFISDIKLKLPPLARIEALQIKSLPILGDKAFIIKDSFSDGDGFVLISPDIATCDKCLGELFTPTDRHFRYPFINCTNCGPRFTIIKDIPYDRDKTTMHKFKMCSLCQEEYDDPRNRRFHAQPNCCDACGPQIELVESREFRVKSKGGDAIIEAVQLLRAGKAVAIKGIGGFHLACDATNFSAVNTLRSRKYREDKPFALMARNITVIKSFCYVSEEEEKLLLSIRRPIVLLRKKEPSLITEHKLQIADGVAPKQKYYGVMLPYTPLHHLLLNNSGLILVMTSGNVSDEPISYTNEEAFTRLKSIADYFLWHDREIYIRCDDSVTRCFEDKEILVRRARGYVPEPIELPFRLRNHILACGAELKNTFCLARDNYAFISQHIGDLENLETLTSFEKGIEHFKNLFSISPSIIAYDLHPEYLSTKYAQKLKTQNSKLKTVGIQHHHAHIASCMAENNIEDKVIGVAFDGLGYGIDGAFWGGEFIVADFSEFIRVAYLEYVSMPGGTKAIKEPYRMAISYLYKSYGNEILDLEIEFINRIPKKQLQLLTNVISNKLNSPLTSSVGRLFDAVSSLLGICDKVNYEGQSAIELEMAIKVKSQKSKVKSYGYTVIKEDEVFIVDPKQIIMGIIEDLKKAIPVGVISFKLHNTIVEIIVNICKRIHNITGLNKVVLSGGVFQNMFLLSNAVNRLRVEGFEVYTHHKVPTNDGGISLGQVAIAAHREELCV